MLVTERERERELYRESKRERERERKREKREAELATCSTFDKCLHAFLLHLQVFLDLLVMLPFLIIVHTRNKGQVTANKRVLFPSPVLQLSYDTLQQRTLGKARQI